MGKKLSVIIPSYKDPYLQNTIESVLENAVGEVEIIAVLDGYWVTGEQLINDSRVRYVHLGKNGGMRNAINTGVRVSTGDYLMRSDEHCMFAPGFDEAILSDIQDNWIVAPKRYFLDVDKWEVMDIAPVFCEKLKPQDCGDGVIKWMGQPWLSMMKKMKDQTIVETMACQGSCWFMSRKLWDEAIKELNTERYGTMLGDSHEMLFKVWKHGGRMMYHTGTWYAHKHVSFPRTHQHSKKDWSEGVTNLYNDYKDYYEKEVCPMWKI